MTTPPCLRRPLLRPLAAAVLLALCAGGSAARAEPAPPAAGTSALAPELAQLREQIAQLRQTLERLDGRLQQLEHAPPTAHAARGAPAADAVPPAAVASVPAAAVPAPAASVAPVPAPVPAPMPPPAATATDALDAHQQAVLQDQVRTTDALNAWREVHNGMRQDEVRRLLGEPQSTLNVGNRTGWIYTYRNAGKGSIFFDHDGAVVSMISPSQGALHLY